MILPTGVFVLLLGVATAAVLTLTLLVWWRTRSICFPIGFAALYFWSLHGGWLLVRDIAVNAQRTRYEYLFTKLFPIQLDLNYALMLVLYAGFILLIQGTVLFLTPSEDATQRKSEPVLYIAHTTLLLITLLCGAGSYILIRPYLMQALALNLPVYGTISSQMITSAIPFYTVHQLLIGIALLAGAIGLASYASGSRPRYVSGGRSRWLLVAYMIILLTLAGFSSLLGKKHELFFALLTGVVWYLTNSRTPRRLMVMAIGGLGLLALGFVDVIRAVPLTGLRGDGAGFKLTDAVTALVSSNEAFGGHFSLYGVLQQDLPLTYGASFVSLASSAIPRAFGVPRPQDSYGYYAQGVQAMEGQQYSILHTTGWYLNFGVPGVALGAVLLGALWAWLYRQYAGTNPRRFLPGRAAAALAFCTFSVGIPKIIRAGPEAYKGVVIELLLLPVGLLLLASYRISIHPRHHPEPTDQHAPTL